MGYGYDPEETTGQEHMDDTAPESGQCTENGCVGYVGVQWRVR